MSLLPVLYEEHVSVVQLKSLRTTVDTLRRRQQAVLEETKEGSEDCDSLTKEARQIERNLSSALVALNEVLLALKRELVKTIPRTEWPKCPCCNQRMKPSLSEQQIVQRLEQPNVFR
jgi:hypothetical protein